MTEDIVDMSIVRIFKKLRRKKWEYVSTLLCLFSAELSKGVRLKEPMLFQNICSNASMVQGCWNSNASMVQYCWNIAKTRVRTKK